MRFALAMGLVLGMLPRVWLQSPGSVSTPALTLKGVSSSEFEAGAIIRIPADSRCTAIEVRVPAGSGTSTGAMDLYIDDVRASTEASTQGGDLILAVQVNGGGLLPGQESNLRLVRSGRISQEAGRWIVARSKSAYVDAAIATSSGRAPDVRIDLPRSGSFVLEKGTPQATVQGAVVSRGLFKVSIDGRPVALETAGDESRFSTDVEIAGRTTQIEVVIDHTESNARRRLLLPVAFR